MDSFEAREKRHRRRVGVAIASSSLATFLIALFLMWPFGDRYAGDSRWGFTPLAVSAMLAFVVAILIDRLGGWYGRTWHYVGVSLVVPVACLVVWGIWLRPAHEVQNRAFDAFARYTGSFQTLGEPSISDRWNAKDGEENAKVCATQGGRNWFDLCLILVVDGRARALRGGFRWRLVTTAGGSTQPQYFGCFGVAIDLCRRGPPR
jgi:hypothetical protein